jgi:tetratricopeptide (TPR) repeat protein
VSDVEVKRLDTLASELDLSADTAIDIEHDAMGDTKEAILQRHERLDKLYAQAHLSHQKQQWQVVVDVFEQIRAENPDYPDSAGLVASAREALETQERLQRVTALYDRGQRHIGAGEWQQALECLEEVQRLEPGYRETEESLSQLRQELAPPSAGEVPNLVGKGRYEARNTLYRANLTLGMIDETPSGDMPKGKIIKQYPAAGAKVEPGSSIRITLSSGR